LGYLFFSQFYFLWFFFHQILYLFFTVIFFPLKFFLNGYFFHGFMISMVADAINPSWLIFFFIAFLKYIWFFFLFFSFNIKLFNEWASWYYSTCLRTHSPWYYGWVSDFVSWSRWAHIKFFFTFFKIYVFFTFHPSTFYLLEIEFHFLFFFLLWSYYVFIWFIRNWCLNYFFLVLFSMRLFQLYVHDHKVFWLTWFN